MFSEYLHTLYCRTFQKMYNLVLDYYDWWPYISFEDFFLAYEPLWSAFYFRWRSKDVRTTLCVSNSDISGSMLASSNCQPLLDKRFHGFLISPQVHKNMDQMKLGMIYGCYASQRQFVSLIRIGKRSTLIRVWSINNAPLPLVQHLWI